MASEVATVATVATEATPQWGLGFQKKNVAFGKRVWLLAFGKHRAFRSVPSGKAPWLPGRHRGFRESTVAPERGFLESTVASGKVSENPAVSQGVAPCDIGFCDTTGPAPKHHSTRTSRTEQPTARALPILLDARVGWTWVAVGPCVSVGVGSSVVEDCG